MMAGGAVTWSSKRQATVALSMVEAEYVAMSRSAQQMVWMQTWLDEVEIEYEMPGIIKGDSRGAIALVKNMKDHGKVKHIDIHHHYVRELVKSGSVLFEQVPSADNLANLFTKPLAREQRHGSYPGSIFADVPYVHGGVSKYDHKHSCYILLFPYTPFWSSSRLL